MSTNSTQQSASAFLAPRFWPIWLMFGLLRCLAWLPWPALCRIGPALGRIAYHLARRRRHIADVNLALCFPDLELSQRQDLLRRHFESLGMAVVESAMAWWYPEQKLRALTRMEGTEHIQDAFATGQGVIFLGAHYTTLEIGGTLWAIMGPVPGNLVYRPHENPLVDYLVTRYRSRRIGGAVPRDDIKTMVRKLRKGEVVWFASDQNFGLRHSVFSPFFGVAAATNSAPSRLAKLTGAKLVPFVSQRLPDGQGYRIATLPALTDFPSDDPQRDMDRINKVIEEQVRHAPEQYLWVHRRFKDRPPGERDVYAGASHA